MRLAAKLTFIFALGILTLLGVYFYLQTRYEVVLYDIDVRRGKYFGRGASTAFSEIWREEGVARAQHLVAEMDRSRPDVRFHWVWLDVAPGTADGPVLEAADGARLLAGETVMVEREDAEGHWRYTYVPLAGPPGRPAALELRESLAEEATYSATNRLAMVGATMVIASLASALALGFGFLFVGRPVSELLDNARRIAAGDLTKRLVVTQHDEIGDLARAINVMSDQLEEARRQLAAEMDARISALDALRHADRLATVGRLAAGVAHELGTPLNVIELRAKMITSGPAVSPETAEHARLIAEQSKRMAQIIRQLLDFARRRPANPEPGDLRGIVAGVMDLLGPVARRGKVQMLVEKGDQPVIVRVDRTQIEQALGNLIMNGVQAMPNGGRLVAHVGWRSGRDPSAPAGEPMPHPCVTIEDEGSGIAAENLSRLFEPFFTTKPVGEGTGLGLSVTHGIVADHGGWIDIESEVGRGTRFHVYLASAETPRTVAQGAARG